jgi:L-amino acid N-acyltransferase YncA
MSIEFRALVESDWPAVLRVANEALANAPDGNVGWLEARKSFDETRRRRRHYVAETNGEIVGYGAVEESNDSERWRLFAVMAVERLRDGLGDAMLKRLLSDFRELGGNVAWMREQADDRTILAFAAERGFAEARRFVVRDGGAYGGIEVVELELALPADPTSNSNL